METGVQFLVDSDHRFKKWYLTPCLTLSTIRYVSRLKWSNRGKGVEPSPTPPCSSYWKGDLRVTLDNGRQWRKAFQLIRWIFSSGIENGKHSLHLHLFKVINRDGFFDVPQDSQHDLFPDHYAWNLLFTGNPMAFHSTDYLFGFCHETNHISANS